MAFRFFAKTDKTPKQRFFNPQGQDTAEDVVAGSTGQDQTDSGVARLLANDSSNLSYRQLRFHAPKYTLEELLEKLMQNAEKYSGNMRTQCLEKMLSLLQNNLDFVNRPPKNFHSNPLELVIKIGNDHIAKELLKLKANVRPGNRHLLNQIKHLLEPEQRSSLLSMQPQ